MSRPQPSGVPAIPNASVVHGRVVAVKPEPDGYGTVLDIAVDEASGLDGMADFVGGHIGQTIRVYAHPEFRVGVGEGAEVEARVAFRGDARGGRFALIDGVRELSKPR